jgi:ABC-type phosphate transport system substrate-binding protein
MQSRSKLSHAVKAALVAAALAPLAASAAPRATLFGGGASLPATAYVGPSWFTGNPPGGGSEPVPVNPRRLSEGDAGSLFGQYTASTTASPIPFFGTTTTRPKVSYCQTGSGTGKNVFTGGATGTTVASDACPDYPTSATGFGAKVAEPNFAGTDSPLATSDITNFNNNKASTHLQPVQFPSIAAAIAVVYNNGDVSNTLTLTESRICKIFAGEISNWSELGFPAKPITLVYRSDGSGTSFGFSNHLSKVCPTAQPSGVSGFSTNQTFLSAFPGGVAPAGAVGASGNGAVTTSVAATDGAIGFADVADTATRQQLDPSITLSYANVQLRSGKNPATGRTYKKMSPLSLPAAFKVALVNDKVIGANDVNGRPTLVDLEPAPARSGCVKLADPESYATSSLNAKGDYTQYPIVAVTYLLAYATGNGQNTRNIQALLAAPYTKGAEGSLSDGTVTIGSDKGYTYLGGFTAPFAKIQSCVTN